MARHVKKHFDDRSMKLTGLYSEEKTLPLVGPGHNGSHGVSRDHFVADSVAARPVMRRSGTEDVTHVRARVNEQRPSAHPDLE